VDVAVDYIYGPKKGTAIDVGAGEGWATSYLRELGFDATGVERSPDVAARAPEGLVLVGNAQALPVPDASQDFVLCNSILEHVLDPDQVMDEIARVLKPGGTAVLTTTNRWHPTTGEIEIPLYPYLPRRLKDRLWQRSGRKHITPHFFTYGQLREMAAERGLRCDTTVDLVLAKHRPGLKNAVAGAVAKVPGGTWLLEAAVGVVKVRLVKTA
jgi:ubiquinone/menaquinone biosynthesis C-methylase UbiE